MRDFLYQFIPPIPLNLDVLHRIDEVQEPVLVIVGVRNKLCDVHLLAVHKAIEVLNLGYIGILVRLQYLNKKFYYGRTILVDVVALG